MPFTIAVQDTDVDFPCEPGETLLDGAFRAGYEIPSSCRKGVCGTCKGQVLDGEVRAFAGEGVTAAERESGHVLFCQTRPRSDLTIKPRSFSKVDPFARKTLVARVFRLVRMPEDVMLVHLRFPVGQRVRFRAGQYLSVVLDNGERRNFSMANPPKESDGVQLHIRLVRGGAFTGHVFSTLKQGDHLTVEIPFGDFLLSESDKPALLVAGSTGFAPLKSIIEHALQKGLDRDLTLYWGARRREGLYSDLPEKWAAREPRFRYVPVVSDEAAPGVRSGLVHRAVVEDHPSLAGFEAYVCGVPAMTAAARRDFTAAGLPDNAFFVDAFITQADTASLADN